MARKSTRKLLSAGQYERERNFFLDLLLSLAPPLFHVPARSSPSGPSYKKAIQQKDLPAPDCGICKYPEGLTIGLHCKGTLLTYAQLLVRQDPRSFSAKLFASQPDAVCTWGYSVPEAGLCSCPYPILSPSIQYRLFGAITTCHKPHCNRAKIQPTFVVAVPTLRSLSTYKRSIVR